MPSPVDSFIVSIRCSGNAPAGLISKTKYSITALTAANFAAQNTAVAALAAAEANLSDGVLADNSIAISVAGSGAYPANAANRGEKWIITAENTNGRKFTYTIPAANETANLDTDNYTALLTSTDWAAYVTAFNAVARDPNNLALTLLSAKLGGRRR